MCAVLSVLFKTIQIKAIQNFAILFVSCVLRIENIFHMSFYIGTNGVPEITRKLGFIEETVWSPCFFKPIFLFCFQNGYSNPSLLLNEAIKKNNP